MVQRSRGCLRCRQRRVRCDQGRPSCQRCLTRNELCIGYRDEADLIFQHETAKTVLRHRSEASSTSSSEPRRSRSQSLPRTDSESPPDISPIRPSASREDAAIAGFFEKYILYPCTNSSSSGFLEHLPCLFKDVNVEGRHALRWAVQAAAFADYSRTADSEAAELTSLALECYGRALGKLGESMAERGKVPDDYDLNCVVVLDLFESLYLPETAAMGAHAQGMAHILRLRGHEQFHDPRGWGLFRLAHHRIQKQHLAKKLSPLPESKAWLDCLHQDQFVRLEQDALRISTLCDKANSILGVLNSGSVDRQGIVRLVQEMHALDAEATKWRQRAEWSFRTVRAEDIAGYRHETAYLPDTVQIHGDVWMAYEWNYHRTARILLHQQLLACLTAIESDGDEFMDGQTAEVMAWKETSIMVVRTLAEEILSTVAQSFGDVDGAGRSVDVFEDGPSCRAIGAYFMLWPVKIMKSEDGVATDAQKEAARLVFERIRETTGMKRTLGALSIV
ncbi:Zn2/Cys6 DNA-binding protein [Pochonia chlamydosporia 170]|uniref:Zn2/Cys6 DNA-binding protein n=1 Tax=Pochonia chlamydosporia 170 TaxID=1380566 RepID=A0A179G8C0_METCM|nr:Zn2/Cys6 DNA-binding protein [Pochonia chlamydosporia 170]OAQ73740.1 Zn2/Cys6 DNA-binding protein [Pochonia chlamydosporia 170]